MSKKSGQTLEEKRAEASKSAAQVPSVEAAEKAPKAGKVKASSGAKTALVEALKDFIASAGAERDAAKAAAIEKAGGDKYKAESLGGFRPQQFEVITKAEAFLKELSA